MIIIIADSNNFQQPLQDHPSHDITSTYGTELAGKRIVLCIAGSVAAYKAIDLTRLLMRYGAKVSCAISDAATRLIQADYFKWASGNKVITDLTGDLEHIEMADYNSRTDIIIVYPATANTLGKLANGIDDTPISTILTVGFGAGIPILMCPAMHSAMYENVAVKRNIEFLKGKIRFAEPIIAEGKAKAPEAQDVLALVIEMIGSGADATTVATTTTTTPTTMTSSSTTSASAPTTTITPSAPTTMTSSASISTTTASELTPTTASVSTTSSLTTSSLTRTASSLKNKEILMTAGPTLEYIDPVRVITNMSTGKTGTLLASELTRVGAKVTLVYGPGAHKAPNDINVIHVTTGQDMFKEVKRQLEKKRFDVIVMAAAVSDYVPKLSSKKKKMKSSDAENDDDVTLTLKRAPKIINIIRRQEDKKTRSLLVGFKAEANVSKDALVESARRKIAQTGADIIMANDIGDEYKKDTGTNEVFVVDEKTVTSSGCIKKEELVKFITAEIERRVLK